MLSLSIKGGPKFSRGPKILGGEGAMNPSFRKLCDLKLSGLDTFDNMAIIH